MLPPGPASELTAHQLAGGASLTASTPRPSRSSSPNRRGGGRAASPARTRFDLRAFSDNASRVWLPTTRVRRARGGTNKHNNNIKLVGGGYADFFSVCRRKRVVSVRSAGAEEEGAGDDGGEGGDDVASEEGGGGGAGGGNKEQRKKVNQEYGRAGREEFRSNVLSAFPKFILASAALISIGGSYDFFKFYRSMVRLYKLNPVVDP
jgi:hypothetical protein